VTTIDPARAAIGDAIAIAERHRCVLGQEYGNYHHRELRHTLSAPPTDLGFNARAFQVREGRLAELAALTDAWRTLIQARRNAEDPWAHWADEPDAEVSA
jgi:hypothetical protein